MSEIGLALALMLISLGLIYITLAVYFIWYSIKG
jgi:hypothetical protein